MRSQNITDGKIINESSGMPFKTNILKEDLKRFENTYDRTANISNNTINMISNDVLYPKSNKFESKFKNQIKIIENNEGNL